jgi:hypothetical protein
MKKMLVIVNAKEAVFMIRNMVVPFLEALNCRDMNIHVFKILNAKRVPKNTVLRRPKISETTRMTVNCLLKHGIPLRPTP